MNPVERSTMLASVAAAEASVAEAHSPKPPSIEHQGMTSIPRSRSRRKLVRRMLLAADALALSIAFFVAQALFGSGAGGENALVGTFEYLFFFLVIVPGWFGLATIHGLYRQDEERADHSTVDELFVVFQAIAIGTWLVMAGAAITEALEPQFVKVFSFSALAICTVAAARVAARTISRREATYLQNAVILGAGDVGRSIARKIHQHPEYAINVVGLLDADPKERVEEIDDLPVLGSPDRMAEIVSEYNVVRVIVAFSSEPDHRTLAALRSLNGSDVQIDIVPRLFELVGPAVKMHSVEALPLLAVRQHHRSGLAMATRRTLDVVSALALLLLTAPFFLYAAWRVKRESPGPIFFRQKRLGKDMKEFTVLKFRTMKADADDGEHRDYIKRTMESHSALRPSGLYKLDRTNVVTPFGSWLRKTSLDELPQLINVLRGDMSLVGPRPCLRYETEHFEPHHFERFLVPAGMTGLWQTTARARASFREALDMDVTYARNWSLALDLLLLFRTPLQLVRLRATA
jgi:exopolysaccharide biosynthesis polyprenyl glycosylphosphotransferase